MAFFQNPTTKHENITNRDLMSLKSVGQKMATHQQLMVILQLSIKGTFVGGQVTFYKLKVTRE